MFQYRAFVSYSHAADDTIAPQLQKALSQFARPWRKVRALRIFRDQTNLALNPHLWGHIEKALDQSQYFILLASPEAAQSEWVRREIDHWLAHRSPDTLLIVLTKGEIVWDTATNDFDWTRTSALPATLSRIFNGEPLYSDFREARTRADLSLRNPDFRNQIARIAATLHGQSLDELIGEDVQQHRKFRLFTRSVFAGLAVLLIAAAAASWTAWQQRTIADSRELAATSLAQLATRADLAVLLALEAVAISPTDQAEQTLRDVSIKASLRADLMRVRNEANQGPKAEPFTEELHSPDGRLILQSDSSRLQVLDAKTSETLVSFTRHADEIGHAAFSPDSALIASVDEGGGGYVWDARTGDVTFTLESSSAGDSIRSVVWSPDGRYLAIGRVDRSVHVLRVGTWSSISSLDEHSGAVDKIAFSRDGSLLVTGSTMDYYNVPADVTVHVWQPETGKVLHELTDERRALEDLGFSADGSFVVTEYEDGTTRLWDAVSGGPVASWALGEFSFVAPGMDELVRTITAGMPNLSGGGLYGIVNLAFTPDGRFLIAVDEEGGATVWRMPAAILQAKLPIFTDNVSHRFAFSSDGTKIFAKDYEKVRIWDIATWKEAPAAAHALESEIATFAREDESKSREVLSPDGHAAVELVDETGANSGTVVDKRHGGRLGDLTGSSGPLVAAAFSPDSLKIAVADGSPDVLIHRWESMAPLDDLIVLSRDRAGRELRPSEREQFVPPTLTQLVRAWFSSVGSLGEPR